MGTSLVSMSPPCYLLLTLKFSLKRLGIMFTINKVENSSLHWLILGFLDAFFVQWSILKASFWGTIYSIVQKRTIWDQNKSMETTRILTSNNFLKNSLACDIDIWTFAWAIKSDNPQWSLQNPKSENKIMRYIYLVFRWSCELNTEQKSWYSDAIWILNKKYFI